METIIRNNAEGTLVGEWSFRSLSRGSALAVMQAAGIKTGASLPQKRWSAPAEGYDTMLIEWTETRVEATEETVVNALREACANVPEVDVRPPTPWGGWGDPADAAAWIRTSAKVLSDGVEKRLAVFRETNKHAPAVWLAAVEAAL